MLHLRAFDSRQTSFRLPLGKVVVAPAECAFGGALEKLSAASGPAGLAAMAAYRAVRIGRSHLYSHPPCGGETCMKGFDADVTVTDGCQIRPRDAVIAAVVTPRSYPQGQMPPAPRSSAAKLTTAARYEEVFGSRTDLPADRLVWAVVVDEPLPSGLDPSTHIWFAPAVDACTDWRSSAGTTTTLPSGWASMTDLSGTPSRPG